MVRVSLLLAVVLVGAPVCALAQDGDIILVPKKKVEEAKKKVEQAQDKVPPGSKRIVEASREQLGWADKYLEFSRQALERARRAPNSAAAYVARQEAERFAGMAERRAARAVGDSPPSAEPVPSSPEGGGGGGVKFRSGGALEQLIRATKLSEQAGRELDATAVKQRAQDAFGAGRASSGGIALYLPATFEGALDMRAVKAAAFEGGRLVLTHGGRKLSFPLLDTEYLALAVRSVYGGEGLVPGTVVHADDRIVVAQTGRERFGEVLWRREFLATPLRNVKIGQRVDLAIGPGIGLMALPEPSMDRVTYYGPLRDSRMGQVLMEADHVLSTVFTGVHRNTGLPIAPPKIPGFATALERGLKNPEPQSERREKRPWWRDAVLWTFVPDQVSLTLDPGGQTFRFTEVRMKLEVWSGDDANVTANAREAVKHFTEHYRQLASTFPALRALDEVAKVVAAVRWLHESRVPGDALLTWAKGQPIRRTPTPDKVRKFTVIPVLDDKGLPVIER